VEIQHGKSTQAKPFENDLHSTSCPLQGLSANGNTKIKMPAKNTLFLQLIYFYTFLPLIKVIEKQNLFIFSKATGNIDYWLIHLL